MNVYLSELLFCWRDMRMTLDGYKKERTRRIDVVVKEAPTCGYYSETAGGEAVKRNHVASIWQIYTRTNSDSNPSGRRA